MAMSFDAYLASQINAHTAGDDEDGIDYSALYFVGDREADDNECEGDFGINLFEGPFTIEDARDFVRTHKPLAGFKLKIRKDDERAMTAQWEAKRERDMDFGDWGD